MDNVNLGQLTQFLIGVAVYIAIVRKSEKKTGASAEEKNLSAKSTNTPTFSVSEENGGDASENVDIFRIQSHDAGISSPLARRYSRRPRSTSSASSNDPAPTFEFKIPELQLGPVGHHSTPARYVAPIVRRIDESVSAGKILVVGIAGGSGSGKTTLARAIYDTLGPENITYIAHDSYYRDISHLPLQEREKQNFDHPDSLETSLLVEHIESLKDGVGVRIPTYDFSTHSRNQEVDEVFPRPIILVEGILILSDLALVDLLDIKVFVDTDDDIRLIRRLQRDTTERGRSVDSVVNQYLTTVRPMHAEFVEPAKRNADIIVPVGLNSVALDLVVAKLRSTIRDFGETGET